MNIAWRLIRSCKTELKVVAGVLSVLFLLPLFAVVVIANAGISEVAHALASFNPITHKVEVKDANGNIVTQMDATTVWPVTGYVSEEFGVPHMPWQPYHTGIDIANEHRLIGDPVTVFMKGKVIDVIDSDKGFGKHVIVSHDFGITSLYGHMSALYAKKDQEVKPGDIIGLEGSTGSSTGPHVHFEVRISDIPVNPHTFMVGKPQLGSL